MSSTGEIIIKRILVVGAGFAGLWSSLAAARLLHIQGVPDTEAEVVVIAPQPVLHMRPRLYEDNPATMVESLAELFHETGIRFVPGSVHTIDVHAQRVVLVDSAAERSDIRYDRLVLATGSQLYRPPVPGLAEHAFSVDQVVEAVELDVHLKSLAARPETLARNTVVVIGGGFTGIEIAAELPSRLRRLFGETAAPIRVVIIERADAIGPELGAGPRPIIEEALKQLGVEVLLLRSVTVIGAGGVQTTIGEDIAADTVIWTAGMRASPLAMQIPGEKDQLGRVVVDRDLRAPKAPRVFVAGDVGRAATDDQGNHTLMSCQHALLLGRSAGNNAAADLLGVPTIPYTQPNYKTTLDLGSWGAVRTEGWDRVVTTAGPEAKVIKQTVNSRLIYPPPANRQDAFEAANPVAYVEKRREGG